LIRRNKPTVFPTILFVVHIYDTHNVRKQLANYSETRARK